MQIGWEQLEETPKPASKAQRAYIYGLLDYLQKHPEDLKATVRAFDRNDATDLIRLIESHRPRTYYFVGELEENVTI